MRYVSLSHSTEPAGPPGQASLESSLQSLFCKNCSAGYVSTIETSSSGSCLTDVNSYSCVPITSGFQGSTVVRVYFHLFGTYPVVKLGIVLASIDVILTMYIPPVGQDKPTKIPSSMMTRNASL